MIAILLNLSLAIPLFLGHGTQTIGGNRFATWSGTNAQDASDVSEVLRLNQSVVELYKQGKYDEALPLAKQALELAGKSQDPSRAHLGTTITNLAEIYLAKKKSENAEKLFEQALAAYEKEQPLDSLAIAGVLQRLAHLRFLKDDPHGAEGFLERSVAIREKTFGSEDTRTADALSELAILYQSDGHSEKAEPLSLRALSIRERSLSEKERTLGPSDPRTVEAMKKLACSDLLSRPSGKSSKSEKLPDEILERAYCWLGGLKDNCAENFGKPGTRERGVLKGRMTRFPPPQYPAGARADGAIGPIFVSVLIDESGSVIKAQAVCGGHPALINASVEAARGAKFSPTVLDGKLIQVTGLITYNFVAR